MHLRAGLRCAAGNNCRRREAPSLERSCSAAHREASWRAPHLPRANEVRPAVAAMSSGEIELLKSRVRAGLPTDALAHATSS